jgi:tRNA threonylcarbamoyladenosine biosynthesis protein TsaE
MPISHSLDETKQIASDWVDSLTPSTDEALVIGLSGHLGAGKTAFTQAVAKKLGVREFVTSPTFVIMKIYDLPAVGPRGWKRLVHIDAYRLELGQELEVLNFEQIVSDPNNLVMIEWPENVKEALPENIKTIKFESLGEGEREINF